MKQTFTIIPLIILLILNLSKNNCTAQTSIVTQDTMEVAIFQNDAYVIGFDTIPPNGGGGASGNTGVEIQPESQITNEFINLGVEFSSTGGPIAVISVEGLSNSADAKSPFNIIGGSVNGTSLPRISYLEPIILHFYEPNTNNPTQVDRVGAWNDPTGSIIILKIFDDSGSIIDSVTAEQGFFVGLSYPNISSASFTYLSTQSSAGFSLDDVTIGKNQTTSLNQNIESSPRKEKFITINSVYPNPPNNIVNVEYEISESSEISISIYDMTGKKIKQIFEGFNSAGQYNFSWDASDSPNGIYNCLIQGGNETTSIKLIIGKS